MSRMKSSQGIICCGGSKSQPQKHKGGDDKEDQCATSIDSYRPIVCDNLKLVQIQVVFRHGARTPLNFIRGLDEATYDASLEDELQETDFDLEVVKFADGSPAGKSTMEPDLRAKKLKGGAHASILTTVGQKQMYDLGVLLRDWYLPILHVSRFSTQDVYVRSSHVERTIKSVRCLLAGMFGKDHLNEVGPIQVLVKNIYEEDIFPNKLACPALRLIVDMTLSNIESLPGFKQDRLAVIKALEAEKLLNARERKILRKMYGAVIDNEGLPQNTDMDFACLRDDIASRVTHGSAYPAALVPYKKMIEDNAAKTLHAVYAGKAGKHRHDVTRLSIGQLLYTLLFNIENRVDNRPCQKIFLFSGHDTTLAPMLIALGIWDFRWPPFCADLIYELYRKSDTGEYFVRVLYCGVPRRIGQQTRVLVPLDEFRRTIQPYLIIPGRYQDACNLQNFSINI